MISRAKIKAITQNTSEEVLQQYFESKGVESEEVLKESTSSKSDLTNQVNEDLEMVYELAKRDVIVGLFNSQYFPDEYRKYESEYDKIFMLLINQRDKVYQFYDLFVEHSAKQFWFAKADRRLISDNFTIQVSNDKVYNLQEKIKAYMRQHAKGDTYKTELLWIDNDTKCCFLIKGEDMPTQLEEVQNNEFSIRSARLKYDIAFIYNIKDGIVNTFCNEGSRTRPALFKIFIEEILEITDLSSNKSFYNLSNIWTQLVNERPIDFGFNPKDTPRIMNIFIKSISLEDISDNVFITFTVPNENNDYLIRKVKDTLKGEISNVSLKSIQCVVEYKAYHKSTQRKSFTVANNSTCTLNHDGIDKEIAIALQNANIIDLPHLKK